MATSSDEHPQIKRRRGIRNRDTYKRNVVRTARVKGEGYENYKNVFVPPKSIPDKVACKCPRKCHLKFDEQTINQIWNYFYALESKNIQDTYLQTLIEVKEIKRRRAKPRKNQPECQDSNKATSSFKRNKSFAYNLILKGDVTEVCKNVFIQAHGVSRDRVQRLGTLLLQNKPPVDMRGKNRSGNTTAEAIASQIHEHISRFEVKEIHVGGKSKKYLDARLNVSKMYDMFLIAYPELKNEVKYNTYYMYFKENFNYSFGFPQVEVCSQCENFSEKLRNPCLSDYVKGFVLGEQMLHKWRANKFYTTLKAAEDNEDDDVVALSFDFMQSLPLPNIPIEEVFYMRQLWLNVFCIHDVKGNKAHMYMYHEGDGKKSSDEVCSFLLHYIKKVLPHNVKRLLLFSDDSTSQNKNHTVVRFLMNLCDQGLFDSVIHRFPVRGHASLLCDFEFGAIKRALRKVDRIYAPKQYADLILNACKNVSIHHVHADEIFSFNSWWQQFYKESAVSSETSAAEITKDNEIPLNLASYKQFEFSKYNPGKVVAKPFIDGAAFWTFTLSKYTVVPELPTSKAYPLGKVPLNKNKIEDLKKLIKCIEDYKNFYEPFLQWPTTGDECCVEEIYSEVE